MSERWTSVDRYIADLFVPPDPALDAALQSSMEAGLPPINVSPAQGKMLMMLALVRGAKNILEIGTLGGYSTIWLARALPSDGKLVTLEIDSRHAAVARDNIARARVGGEVQVLVGPALDVLPKLSSEGRGPFDLIFVDADKESSAEYFAWALTLSKSGSLIIVDNVVRNGAVTDETSADPRIQGIRRLNEVMAAERRVMVTEIQTVGVKGYDGFAIALVR